MVIAGAMSPIGKMPVNHGKEAGEKPTLSSAGRVVRQFVNANKHFVLPSKFTP